MKFNHIKPIISIILTASITTVTTSANAEDSNCNNQHPNTDKQNVDHLNPYHEPWSCHSIKNNSNDPNAPKSLWVCSREASNKVQRIFDKSSSSSHKKQTTAEALGWVTDSSDTSNTCNSCNGYYYQYPFKANNVPLDQSKTNIDFQKFSENIKQHTLHYQGNVEIIQPSRKLYADDATINYNPATQKPSIITAKGNVKLIQPGEMILAQEGSSHLADHKSTLTNAIYLLSVPSSWSLQEQFKDKNFTGYAHGKADKIIQSDQYSYYLENATYSTCPPTKNTWQLSAKRIDLDKKTNRGVSKHTVIRVLGVPVFYFPYFSFPLGKYRQTGLLYPSYTFNSHNGSVISIPYYFNLAPNYDDTFTPTIYAKNGLMLDNQFRLLTQKHNLIANISYMPVTFNNAYNYRYYGNLSVKSKLSPDISSDLLYQTASDKDYFADFNDNSPQNANQVLLQQHALLEYNKINWYASAMASSYEVINPDLSLENRPYKELPSLNLNYDSIQRLKGFDFNIENQFTNFYKRSNNQGLRTYTIPNINWQSNASAGFVKLNATAYARSYNSIKSPYTNISNKLSIIPQYQILEGLNFIRDFHFSDNNYTQILSPKLGYLYTPHHNQDSLPIFDTTPNTFSYDQIFAPRSFTGYDRIQNSNQLSYALETTISQDDTPTLDLGAGQIYYFTNRKVSVSYNSPSNIARQIPNFDQKTSPLADYIRYHFNKQWSFSLENTFNFNTKKNESLIYNLQYNADPQHIFNVQYQSIRNDYGSLSNSDIINGATAPKNSQIISSFIWQLNPSWHAIGKWNYSLSLHKNIDAFAGVSYDTCCWLSSIGVRRFLDKISDPNNPDKYSGRFNTSIMVQFELKGLGSLSSGQFSDLMTSIPGYKPYASGFR